jgi:hypothetical protein
MRARKIFIRIDDIGQYDVNTIKLIDLLLSQDISLSLGVIPKLVEQSMASYLKESKKEYGKKLDLIQHGYQHDRYEFYLDKNTNKQIEYLKMGRNILNNYLGEQNIVPYFIPPWNIYNILTLSALKKTGYQIISVQENTKISRQIFYKIGHLTNKCLIAGRHISYNFKKNPFGIVEISPNVNCEYFIHRQLVLKPFKNLKRELDFSRKKHIGLLLHPKSVSNKENYKTINKLLEYFKTYSNSEITNISSIHCELYE